MIFVMEKKHKQRLEQRFTSEKEIIILDIPDEYQFMDPELVEVIKTSLSPYINDAF